MILHLLIAISLALDIALLLALCKRASSEMPPPPKCDDGAFENGNERLKR